MEKIVATIVFALFFGWIGSFFGDTGTAIGIILGVITGFNSYRDVKNEFKKKRKSDKDKAASENKIKGEEKAFVPYRLGNEVQDTQIQAAIEKELLSADKFYENLCKIGGWRLAAIFKNAQYCRESLDKAFALNGHTGKWIFDLWVYVVNSLPWFLPATLFFIPGIFYGLVATISGVLSYVTMEPKIFEETITIPFLYFFETTKLISETIMTPVIHAPDIKVATGISICIVVIGILIFSYMLKATFKIELRYRRKLFIRSTKEGDRKIK